MSNNKLVRKKTFCGILPNLPDETMVPGRMRINTDGRKEAEKHFYHRNSTVSDFRYAYILGSGDFGASVHGTPDNYTYHLAKNDLWWDDYEQDPPCYYPEGLEDLRKRIIAGDSLLKQDVFVCANNRSRQPAQTSAARLTLHLCSGGVFTGIREHLDMHSGILTQNYSLGDQNGIIKGRDFTTLSCISPAENVMIISCTASRLAGHLGKVSLELTKDPMEVNANSGFHSAEEIKRLEEEIEKYYTPVPFSDGEYFGFNMRLRSGVDPNNSPDMHYTVMMRSSDKNFKVYSAGSKVIAEGRPQGESVMFLLTIVSTYDAEDTMAEAKRRLDKISGYHMPVSIAAVSDWYYHIWKRSWIRLPDVKYSKPWYWGLYQAMCARKPGKFASGYLAPWYQSTFASWGYHILTYEQAKTNLGLLTTNHSELLEPWFRLLQDSREKLQKFTKGFYGLNGTAYPHAISGTGTIISSTITLNGTMMNLQTTGESVKYCWDYYDFTGDVDFLREVGYPLIRDAAVFYHEYLLTADDGEKYIFPSRTQEFTNTIGLLNEYMTNSLIDLCMFRNTFRNAIAAAKILGTDEELVKLWEEDLAGMRKDYPVWPDGTWKTAEDTDDRTLDYGPAGVTDVSPVAYTGEVDAWHGESPELMEAARRTVMKHIKDNEIPWDRSFGMISRLRLGDSKYAGQIIRLIPEEYETGGNFDDLMFLDCDFSVGKGAASTSEVISEMLLQSQGNVIRVFPAWDTQVGDASFFSLRARGAFLVSAELRDKEVAYAIIRSIRGNLCRVANPFGSNVRVRNLENNELVDFTTENDVISFETMSGYEYVVESSERPLESFPVIE